MNSEPENNFSPEPGAALLRRALGQLPTHEPDAATWPRIAAQLAADAALPRLVAALPTHEPAPDLWAGSAAGLDAAGAATAPRRPLGPPAPRRYAGWLTGPTSRRALALAASLLLLVLAGAGWWQLQHRAAAPAPIARVAPAAHPRETLTISEETVEAALPARPTDRLESQGLAFIKKGCARQPGVCNSTEFQQLNSQLAELQTQQQALEQATRRFGSSPELVREQAHLVNMQAAVTRQLINLLIS